MLQVWKLVNYGVKNSKNISAQRILTWTNLNRPTQTLIPTCKINTKGSSYQKPQVTYTPLKSNGNILEFHQRKTHLEIRFEDGILGHAPFLWLRENCQCPKCFDPVSYGRKFLLKNLRLDTEPVNFREENGTLYIQWNDGHTGVYSKEWLYYRAFTSTGRNTYKKIINLEKESWGKNHKLPKFDYSELDTDHKKLLEWLLVMEKQGAALIINTPCEDDAGVEFINRVAFVKRTHFGVRSPVFNRSSGNNLAFTHVALGLHTDLPSYDYQPGLIFLQMVKQCEGEGGSSSTADGFYGAELLRKRHPDAFKILTSTEAYFWDKGVADIEMETNSFYKIHKGPIIRLDKAGNVCRISYNNQIRDTFLELPYDQTDEFYRALLLYEGILNEISISLKMDSGDMLALDNLRCLHGREAFEATSERHIETFYFDWDQALSRRRVLQHQHDGIYH